MKFGGFTSQLCFAVQQSIFIEFQRSYHQNFRFFSNFFEFVKNFNFLSFLVQIWPNFDKKRFFLKLVTSFDQISVKKEENQKSPKKSEKSNKT